MFVSGMLNMPPLDRLFIRLTPSDYSCVTSGERRHRRGAWR